MSWGRGVHGTVVGVCNEPGCGTIPTHRHVTHTTPYQCSEQATRPKALATIIFPGRAGVVPRCRGKSHLVVGGEPRRPTPVRRGHRRRFPGSASFLGQRARNSPRGRCRSARRRLTIAGIRGAAARTKRPQHGVRVGAAGSHGLGAPERGEDAASAGARAGIGACRCALADADGELALLAEGLPIRLLSIDGNTNAVLLGGVGLFEARDDADHGDVQGLSHG